MGPAVKITSPTKVSFRSRSDQLRLSIGAFPICLVTGGAGYIGSHTVLELLTAGFAVVVIDNLCNSHLEALYRVHFIAKSEFERCGEGDRPVPPIYFHKADIRDSARVNEVFAFWQDHKTTLDPERLPVDVAAMVAKKAYPMLEYNMDTKKRTKPSPLVEKTESHGKIACVIHFAALKAVGESISMPLEYYDTNVTGLLILLKAMKANKVDTFVFSSSAVVYGSGHGAGITEEAVQIAGKGQGGGLLTNPYGRTKWMSEEIINDFCVANPNFHATSLRYFNPTGAHASGLIGENPKGTPNNIVPVILQAYERRRSRVQVFGSSYDTPDGTGVRDYIHVSDLAKGHLAALRKAVSDQGERVEAGNPTTSPGALYHVYNLGTGRGYSVLEIINAFSKAAGTDVPYALGSPRAGDLGTVTASPDKAATELDWSAEFDLQDMCRDVYNWAQANPGGYEKLRRLSILSGMPGSQLRKASIASHIFENEEEFENFVTATSAPSPTGRPQSLRLGTRASIASITSLLTRTRMSISSSNSDEDKVTPQFANYAPQFANYNPMSFPDSPISPGFKQPQFVMNWAGAAPGSRESRLAHSELQTPIEEEES